MSLSAPACSGIGELYPLLAPLQDCHLPSLWDPSINFLFFLTFRVLGIANNMDMIRDFVTVMVALTYVFVGIHLL